MKTFIIYILNLIHIFIKNMIFIIGKTIVLYILVIKSWYLDSFVMMFNIDFNNQNHYELISLGWGILVFIINVCIWSAIFYIVYLYIRFVIFLFKIFNKNFKILINDIKKLF